MVPGSPRGNWTLGGVANGGSDPVVRCADALGESNDQLIAALGSRASGGDHFQDVGSADDDSAAARRPVTEDDSRMAFES